MHQQTRQTIQHSAPMIYELWKISPEARPGVPPPFSTAIKLLDLLNTEMYSLHQLADAMNMHSSTMSEYIAALKAGGIKIAEKRDRLSATSTGRKNSIYFIKNE